MVDAANVPTLVLDVAPTASAGANDMVHVTNDDAGFYDLELAAANVNYLGRAMLAITDAATHCPVFHEFMILPANIYDSLVLGTDLVDVSVTQNAGTAITAAAGIQEVKVASMAAAAITAAAIATDAIDADALAADAVTEIWAKAMSDLAAVPGSTAGVLAGINWLFELARNKRTTSGATETLYKDDGTTALATSAHSDAAGVFTADEYV